MVDMHFRIIYNGQQTSAPFHTLREAALERRSHPEAYTTIWIVEWVDGGYADEPKLWRRVSEERYRKAASF